jgi:predicted thioesterase
MAKHLPEGYTTVGTSVNIKHLAATPVGMEVIAKTELIEIDGRRLVFKVEAFDEVDKIGEGIHERFIVDEERFMKKNEEKKAKR